MNMVHLELQGLGLLPAEGLVGTEMTVLGGLEVDGLGQVELLDNDAGPQVEVVTDDLDKLIRALGGSTVGVDVDGQGLSNTNGVGELDQGAAGEASSDQGLGDPPTNVGSGSVDLGKVLSGEGTTTVGTPATVCVNNNLTTSKTGVTLRTTNDEQARGLDLERWVSKE